jgi:hypothetical protein
MEFRKTLFREAPGEKGCFFNAATPPRLKSALIKAGAVPRTIPLLSEAGAVKELQRGMAWSGFRVGKPMNNHGLPTVTGGLPYFF